MTPGQQSRRETTEDTRRQQQADERIHELEQEVESLREALEAVRRGLKHIAHRTECAATREDAHQGIIEIADALNGGGDQL